MTKVQTRDSEALHKAQKRIALLKSIEETLDLGHGLTIVDYSQAIEKTRAALELHNMHVSNLSESRKNLDKLDSELSELSERMLNGVAAKYGKRSTEYAKAIGKSGDSKTSKSAKKDETPASDNAQSVNTDQDGN